MAGTGVKRNDRAMVGVGSCSHPAERGPNATDAT